MFFSREYLHLCFMSFWSTGTPRWFLRFFKILCHPGNKNSSLTLSESPSRSWNIWRDFLPLHMNPRLRLASFLFLCIWWPVTLWGSFLFLWIIYSTFPHAALSPGFISCPLCTETFKNQSLVVHISRYLWVASTFRTHFTCVSGFERFLTSLT